MSLEKKPLGWSIILLESDDDDEEKDEIEPAGVNSTWKTAAEQFINTFYLFYFRKKEKKVWKMLAVVVVKKTTKKNIKGSHYSTLVAIALSVDIKEKTC